MISYLTDSGQMNLTIDEFRNRLWIAFADNEAQPLPDTALRGLLLEADLLAGEHSAHIADNCSADAVRALDAYRDAVALTYENVDAIAAAVENALWPNTVADIAEMTRSLVKCVLNAVGERASGPRR